jgi:hypothetical protein
VAIRISVESVIGSLRCFSRELFLPGGDEFWFCRHGLSWGNLESIHDLGRAPQSGAADGSVPIGVVEGVIHPSQLRQPGFWLGVPAAGRQRTGVENNHQIAARLHVALQRAD